MSSYCTSQEAERKGERERGRKDLGEMWALPQYKSLRVQSFKGILEMVNGYSLLRKQSIGKKEHREMCALYLQVKDVQMQRLETARRRELE